MANVDKDKLGYLGIDFQYKLMKQILTDRVFGESIIDILKPNYFEDMFLKKVCSKIIDNYERFETIPDVTSLESIIFENVKTVVDKEMLISNLRKVREASDINCLQVQETSLKFCKQQELKKSVEKIKKIIELGDLESYHECEDILRHALEVGNAKDSGIDVFTSISDCLSDDFRQPIPTGISGLDSYMNGGLSKGELAVILAPTGVGKTTLTTKIANGAKNHGQNVLQIFFEDTVKNIQRKHIACWMDGKYELNDLPNHRSEVMSVIQDEEAKPGKIILKRMPSNGTTIPIIKQYVKKLISQGFRPDVLILDYIDCVESHKQFKDSWDGEGNIMREFETMLVEFDMAGWTACQGNRSSISAETVDSSMFGGSIKKAQIGHFILSIAKTNIQKEERTANMAILKSRFGRDGIIFEDIEFNNATISISMSEDNQNGITMVAKKENKETAAKDKMKRIAEELMKKRNQE